MPESFVVLTQPVSQDAFAPYGQVLAGRPGDPDERDITFQPVEEVDLSGGRPIMAALTFRWRELSFTHMEQHASFTQAFLPADGRPVLVVVARPVSGPGSDPDFSDLKAFILDGTQGILLGKGIWHCPLFSLAGTATYTMVGCADTSKESEGYLDVSALAGGVFRVSL